MKERKKKRKKERKKGREKERKKERNSSSCMTNNIYPDTFYFK